MPCKKKQQQRPLLACQKITSGQSLESLLDDQLDEQQVPAVEAYRRAATTKSSAYDY